MIETQLVRIKFSFVCDSEFDGENKTKDCRVVADEALLLVENYAANQTPPGRVRSDQNDQGPDRIILNITLTVDIESDQEEQVIKNTLRNNIENLPPIYGDGLSFLGISNWKTEPENE